MKKPAANIIFMLVVLAASIFLIKPALHYGVTRRKLDLP